MPAYDSIPAINALLQTADYHDVKTIDSDVTLREFVAGFFGYYPGWVKFLYRVRQGFVRLLGMRQDSIPKQAQLQPEQIPMTPGDKLAFFRVYAADDPHYWIAVVDDKHLSAYLAIVAEPAAGTTRYYGLTIVKYHHWTGPVYFNVIRPFHHLVVGGMMRAGAAKLAHD